MYNIYIGADNTTKVVDVVRIEQVVCRYFEGFTLIPATGYYQGEREPSIIAQIEGEHDKVYQCVEELKSALNQLAIGIQEVPTLNFV